MALQRTQNEVLTAPFAALIQQEKDQLVILNDPIHVEEAYLMQKSKIKWLKAGDHNTSFFHKAIKDRIARNFISSLTAANGTLLTDYDQIKNESLSHYESQLGSGSSIPFDLAAILQRLVSTTLREDY